MFTTAQNPTEDLIILDDINPIQTNEIKLPEEKLETENIITFDDNIISNQSDVSSVTVLDTPVLNTPVLDIPSETNTLDFSSLTSDMQENKSDSLDISAFQTNNLIQEVKPLEENVIKMEEPLNLGIASLETSNTSLLDNNEESMNVILDGTISKLKSRKSIVDSNILEKKEEVSNLKEELKRIELELNNKIIAGESKILELQSEGSKIVRNINSMERMKMSDIEAESSKTSLKVHNLKRKAA